MSSIIRFSAGNGDPATLANVGDLRSSPAPCAYCLDLAPSYRFTDFIEFTKGAAGCKACQLIVACVSEFVPPAEVTHIALSIDGPLYLSLNTRDDRHGSPIIEIYTEKGKPTKWRNIGRARTIPPFQPPGPIPNLISEWMRDCADNHPQCAHNTKRVLPTRVIHVGKSNDDLRLHVSAEGETGDYVALSHCWGNKPGVTTVRANYLQHQDGIKLGANSATFADAADLTRALGIPYLWIDSLCIVQDDREDWVVEASRMKDVYRNSNLTFAADNADDPSGSLFGPVSVRCRSQDTRKVQTLGSDDYPVFVYARRRHRHPSNPDSAPHSCDPIAPSKLSTRGWAVQELALSPRIIHFFPQEVVWSCYCVQSCECRITNSTAGNIPFRKLLSEGVTPEHQELLHEWLRFVVNYTDKELTLENDRLPAVSGLAKFVGDIIPSLYCAGIWAADIPFSLLWLSDHRRVVREGRPPARRLSSCPYAPTWSWASVVGPVSYPKRHQKKLLTKGELGFELEPLLQFVKASGEAVTPNSYGPVDNFRLTVLGQLLDVHYDVDEGVFYPSRYGLPRPGTADGAVKSGINVLPNSPPPRVIFDVWSESPGASTAAPHERHAFLRAARFVSAEYNYPNELSVPPTEVVAIVLSAIPWGPDGNETVYQRRGIAFGAFDPAGVWSQVPHQQLVLA